MSTPDPDDEGTIADTGMFKRFVEHEQEMDAAASHSSGTGKWIAITAIIAIIIVAVAVWLLTR